MALEPSSTVDIETYEAFLKALAGLEEDAITEGFSIEGIEHLRAAIGSFRAEFNARHGIATQ
jgi:hypothetical protein